MTVRTFNVHIGVNFARVPVLRDPFGSVFGRGGGINDDPNGGINSDVYFGGLPSFRVIFNFFIFITSNTETRQIQTTEEEQSPASRPMGVGAQQNRYFVQQNNNQYVTNEEISKMALRAMFPNEGVEDVDVYGNNWRVKLTNTYATT